MATWIPPIPDFSGIKTSLDSLINAVNNLETKNPLIESDLETLTKLVASLMEKQRQKLLLVFYVNCDGKSNVEMQEIISNINKNLQQEENERWFIIPVYEGDSKIELLNKGLLKEEEYDFVLSRVEYLEGKFHEAVKSITVPVSKKQIKIIEDEIKGVD